MPFNKNPLNAALFRRQLSDLIAMNPYHVQSWVLQSGDGLGTGNSYVFDESWIGALANEGRQVYQDYVSDSDSGSASKNFVVLLPYDASKTVPTRNHILYLYDMQGNSMGRYWINFVQTWGLGTSGVNSNSQWKIELHVVRIQG